MRLTPCRTGVRLPATHISTTISTPTSTSIGAPIRAVSAISRPEDRP